MERPTTPVLKSSLSKGMIAGTAACGLLLTGCTSSPTPAVKLNAAEGSVAVGSVAAGSPLSASMAAYLEGIQQAQTITRLTCLADNGYPDVAALIPRSHSNLDQRESQVSAEDVFFASAKEAATRGFGQPVPASPAKLIPHDPAFGPISDTCDEQSWQALGADAQATLLEYQQIHARLLAGPMNAVSTSMPKWTAQLISCLSDQGHRVTPGEGSWGMDFGIKLGALQRLDEKRPAPTGTSGLEILPGTPVNPYIPTAEESVLASALYECSKTTGVRDEVDRAILSAQHQAESDNATAIKNLTPKIQALAEKARSLTSP